ncbi:MAG TPA: ABC transporter permease [Gemmatimonadaceae bacterium]|nr:ABC transporter permease [Gemmatimonadaceae bacterium]
MMGIVSLLRRIAAARRRGLERAELDEEIRFHHEMLERDATLAGMSPADARHAARRKFGNRTFISEESGDMWRIQPLETIGHDIRYAVRFLRRSPAFTFVAIVSLALGIGANSAVFTLINAVMVRSLPVANPEQLVLLEPARGENVQQVFPHPYFRSLDSSNTVLDGMFAASREPNVSIDRGSGAEALPSGASLVSGKFFQTLGLRPAIGRLIGPGDDVSRRGHPVVVLSHELWRRSFGGDSGVVGSSLRVNGTPMTIIGVAPEHFSGIQVGEKPDLYMPLLMAHVAHRGDGGALDERGDWWLYVMGRLKPGVTREHAAAELSMLFRRDLLADPPFNRSNLKGMADLQRATVIVSEASSGLAQLRRRFARPLVVLAGMAAIVLLIACTNLASLLSARAAARRKEIAIRLSMGAARGRLLRQLLTESLLLSSAGAVLGLFFAYSAARALLAIASRGRAPLWIEVTPDWRVLAFTAVIAIGTAIVFGVVPALQSTRLELAPSLRSGASAGRGRGTIRLGKTLIAAQVALSVLLVFGGSLFARSLQRLYATEVGFDRGGLVVFRMDPRRVGYGGGQLAAFYAELHDRARSLPGVKAAFLASHVPFTGAQSGFGGRVDGYTPPPDEMADITRVITSDDYFQAMGIALRQGRLPGRADAGDGSGPRFAVVNESFVRHYVPSSRPVGKRFYRGGDSVGTTIVGVVADVKFNSFRDPTPPIAYWTYTADTAFRGPAQSLFVRVDPDVPGVVPSIRALVSSLDRNVEILGVRQLDAQIDATISNERIVASLSGFFGIFALVLAMIGLYGLMAYAVTSRSREIGIRIALGADGSRVARSVMTEALALVAVGLAIGVPAALASGRVGEALLYGMSGADAPAMALTTALLAAVAIFAAAIPAWRASRIDPAGMLRTE